MLLRNTIRKIKKSFGRYLSLLIIILLGVGFYTGITTAIPDIQEKQASYYEETSLADLKVISTLGFNDSDIEAMHLTGVTKTLGTYSKDVLVGENAVRVHAIETKINGVKLVEGRLPKKENECLADKTYYKVGDKITINEDYHENLKVTEYKVVGTIISPLYSGNEYGTTPIGNGKLYSFIFINKDNFDYEYYTEAYLTVTKKSDDIPYSEGYILKTDKITDQLSVVKNEQLTLRKDEIVRQSNGAIKDKDLRHHTWYIQDRDEFVPTYTILDSQFDQVMTIANVIPIFFILIVALMTSNTMTRMIKEERGEMGTLLSLGFGNEEITNNYLLYVLSASTLGAVLGYFIGTLTLPKIVFMCFPLNFPDITYTFRPILLITSLAVTLVLMSGVTTNSAEKELRQQPAYLLRPEPPKKGKKVFLEKIHVIWNRLSFSTKITLRNISRYKKRVLITLIGSAGCTFMIMIGFALKDSINTVGDKQYTDLFKYDSLIILNQKISSIDEKLQEKLSPLVQDELLMYQEAYKVVNDTKSLDVYLTVPEDTNKLFYKYFNLKEKESNKKLKLKDNGVVVTPKIAERFELEIGDEFVIESLSNKEYTLKVSGITENYVSNYIYLSKDYYKEIFNQDLTYNIIASKNKEKDTNKIAKELLKETNIVSVSFREELLKTANEAVKGLNAVVILLVVISSALAFTVLYNLTSINISERTREIATLKVLGFTDNESNAYIYRETLITVIVGIIIGLLITKPLHGIVMTLLEVDHMMFLRTIKVQSYIYSSCLTLIFALIMLVITYKKIQKIDMIESLKSVE
ncbi:MAG: ABC transporter permease [Bacilli bacterium]|nr:ABC transporter permease [Bacilli bacterium]